MSRRECDRIRKRVNSWWKFLLAKMDDALLKPTGKGKSRKSLEILRHMREAVAARNSEKLVELTPDYMRLTRTLPPCVYAFAPPPWKNVYLDGEELEKGLRISKLHLGVVHPQIYR